ncbi:hypothetical protein GE107_19510 [Cohnella sp. CFH 77786]|uniref:hypothetical protein n=1 Tax=Cohnella sp. CFH 77786 TaxID=2662265 RepID=UPI001C60F48A|nr:hypothetical protein [Cohnella sp. CFH 77786]MBW5448238.1 hypothetical protein [Cohnella sp. CFH 77786]
MNTGSKSHFAAGLSFYTLIAVLTVVSLAPFYAVIVMGSYFLFRTSTALVAAYLMTIVIVLLFWVGFKLLNKEGTGR